MKLIKWLATIVEDKEGSISSKRIGFFWCLWMLQRVTQEPVVNEIVIYSIVGLAFGLAGLTIPEWLTKRTDNKTDGKNQAVN